MRYSLPKTLCFVFMFLAAGTTVSRAQTFTKLYDFCTLSHCSDGDEPEAALVQGFDGGFYGTTIHGGITTQDCTLGCGTVFRLAADGTLTTLHSFVETDGSWPAGGVILGADGSFYGTTLNGGSGCAGCGTVFRINAAGMLNTLHNFCSQPNCPDGFQPSGLVQGSDGYFYGVTSLGAANGVGSVFKITQNGTLRTLYSFCSRANCSDGAEPIVPPVQATDGYLYGITPVGGTSTGCSSGCGTFFRMTPSGRLTTLYSFCSQANCADGAYPNSLMQASDGNFYGTAVGGGNCSSGICGGTVFQITPTGTLTTLYEFCSQPRCTDGGSPYAPLIQATDGNFYAPSQSGGLNDWGTIYELTPAGVLTTLHNFTGRDGAFPVAALLQRNDGTFYGSASSGGLYNEAGTAFSLTGPPPSPVQFVPITPCRLVDTRQSHQPIQGGTSQFFIVPQLGGCNIPATAAAYSLNITVVPHGPLGYLTIWAAGRPQPIASTMNSTDGRVKANAAIVSAGASAAVSVFASNTSDVILDINGYFATPGAQTYQFYSLSPCRLVDTRGGHNGGTLQPGVERDYTIAGHCNIPATATAYSFNVTAIPTHGELDYLTVWPEGVSRPIVSTLNDPTGTVVANAAIVPAGTQNATAFYAHDRPTDLLLDVNGYFAPAGTGGLSLYPIAPCRVLDTRTVGSGQPFMGDWNSPDGIDVVDSPCAPPGTSQAFVFNATVVPPGSMPYLTLWPHGTSQPNVSTLNAYDGFITSNMAIVPTNDGSIDAYAAGLTQLILDISGYFAP